MNIDRIEVIPLDMKLNQIFKGGTYQVASRPTIVTRIYLSNGIMGETYGGDEFHTQSQIVALIRDHLAPILVGQDVRMFAVLHRQLVESNIDLGNRGLHQLDMHPRGILMQAISCLDNAMWDARGKHYGVSLTMMLGGNRTRVPVISIGGYYAPLGEDPLDYIASEVDDIRASQICGIKMKVGRATVEEDLARVSAARRAGGKDFIIAVDANQGWSPRDAVSFCIALEKLDIDVRWVEEPIRWEDQTDGLALLASKTSIPITVGQGEITGIACRDLILKGKVDILNLDCTLCGGVTEWQRVANMAAFMNVEMGHHEEPQLAVHLIAANHHGTYVEIFNNRLRDPLLWQLPVDFPIIRNGYMDVPDKPGIGIKLNEEVIQRLAVKE